MRLDLLKYPIEIGALPQITYTGKVLVVSDTVVAPLYLEQVLNRIQASKVFKIVIPTGEVYKKWETLEKILNAAFEVNLSRKDCLVALGGGVVSDMVGFASAIYKRGIAFYNIPTTLLAQVDASIGGKTGINNAYGKNLIGAFHSPKAVYIDPQFLHTLSKRAFYAGVAEMIKKAVCFDASYFEWLENHSIEQHLEQAIAKSITIKAKVVIQDEREEALRMGLNYGHTFGHAIEKAGAYEALLHGEAVAIGMQMANALACQLGLLDQKVQIRIKNLLARYQLDLTYKITNVEQFYKDLQMDKKNVNGITFILPTGLGNFKAKQVPKDRVIEVLNAWC
ncbi:3-dehydroquinate synthase [Helicobacter suis]|uniref:3-dehydroquinate synthase n=1 Tax=Helicobacter suis TaxID=104628 RepID=UPI0013D29E96|nr:3-dehydroquinate synthase [Helicobacter suis]